MLVKFPPSSGTVFDRIHHCTLYNDKFFTHKVSALHRKHRRNRKMDDNRLETRIWVKLYKTFPEQIHVLIW
jgi:hypothetical protein